MPGSFDLWVECRGCMTMYDDACDQNFWVLWRLGRALSRFFFKYDDYYYSFFI